jgi:hypothetical protein
MRTLWAVAVLAAVGGGVPAEDAVTIKLKKPAKGETVKDTKSEDLDVSQAVNGKVLVSQEVKSSSTYTDEVLEAGEKGKPTKLKRTYESMTVSVGGKKPDLGLDGKTVLIEKGKEKYTFSIDGKEVSAEAAKLLDKEFNKQDGEEPEELMLPKKAVKPGDTWDVDVKAVEKMFGEDMKVDTAKAKATGKLVKVYDQDKAKFGVIEFTIELPIASIEVPGVGAVDATAGSKLTVNITLDACIDGTRYAASSTGTVGGEVGAKVQGMAVSLTLGGKMTSKGEAAKK